MSEDRNYGHSERRVKINWPVRKVLIRTGSEKRVKMRLEWNLGIDESGSGYGTVCLQDLHEFLSRFHVATHIVTVASEPHTL